MATATKNQLYIIATVESCSLDDKYAAARELQKRAFKSHMVTDLVRLYPVLFPNEIAEKLGIPVQTVESKARQLGLKQAIKRSAWI
jgi:hypothetical protein